MGISLETKIYSAMLGSSIFRSLLLWWEGGGDGQLSIPQITAEPVRGKAGECSTHLFWAVC